MLQGGIISKFLNLSLLLPLLVLLICGCRIVEGDSYNFGWNPVSVSGAANFVTKGKIMDRPLDFINTGAGPLIADTYNSRLIIFQNGGVDFSTFYQSQDGYIFPSVEQTPNYKVLGTQNSTRTTSGTTSNDFGTDVTPQGSNYDFVYGLTYSLIDDLLYVTDSTNCRVLTFDVSGDISSPQAVVYGQSSTTATDVPSSPSSTSLLYPLKTRLDCNNNLWVVDSGWARILRFPQHSNVADLVLGQDTLDLALSEVSQTGMTNPQDIVFTTDCSVAFVADGKRILRFRAPFYTGMPAEGVLGAANFTTTNTNSITSATFGRISRLQLLPDPNNSGTGTLSILDIDNNRLLTGLTNWTFVSTTPSITPSRDSSLSSTNSASPRMSGVVGQSVSNSKVANSGGVALSGTRSVSVTPSLGSSLSSSSSAYPSGSSLSPSYGSSADPSTVYSTPGSASGLSSSSFFLVILGSFL